jgi:ligand-binding SRPBCC domain-containing protein
MTAAAHAPANAHVYEKATLMKTSIDRMIAFHRDPAALGKLTPPPIFVRLRRDDRTAFDQGELEFTLWFGPLPIRWLARHEAGPTPTSFADRMIVGPLAYWLHEHLFEETPDGVILRDRVTLAHKPGLAGVASRLMFDGLPLRVLFFYRHLRTRLAVERVA